MKHKRIHLESCSNWSDWNKVVDRDKGQKSLKVHNRTGIIITFWWIIALSFPCENETFESHIIFKLFMVFVIVLCIRDDVWIVLKACPLASTPMPADSCLRRRAGWGRVEWTRDMEYWERMVDDYQTQHGEGNETESVSNRSLCHRVSMIQMFLCDGKYTLESTFSKHACKQEVYFSMSCWESEEWWAFFGLICETQTSWLENISIFFLRMYVIMIYKCAATYLKIYSDIHSRSRFLKKLILLELHVLCPLKLFKRYWRKQ